MENIEIRKMELTDLESIKNIFTSDFDNFWSFNVLKEELDNEHSNYLLAKFNKEIVGFAGIKIVLDEADIMNIVTKKNYRGNGIGTMLLNNLIYLCSELGIKTINLEVSEENLPAIHLYEKFGFKIIGNRKNYYQSKNAILMKKTL